MRGIAVIGLTMLAIILAVPAKAALTTKAPDEEPVLITAERLEYDQQKGIVTATGNVEVTRQTPSPFSSITAPVVRTLLADKVVYDENKHIIDATGHVALIEPTGEVVFADAIKVSDDLNYGTIRDLRARMSDNSRLAANGARREAGVKTEMVKGVFTPCEACKTDPNAPPLWQIRADKVVHDQRTHDLEYYDAFLDVYGIPIFYTPYLSHPDPTVKQRSGLLAPTYGNSSDLGIFVGLPYYWGIDQSEDVVFRPIFTQNQGPVFSGEYRKRFEHGKLSFSSSITEGDFTNSSGIVKDNVVRGHVFSEGRFDPEQVITAKLPPAHVADEWIRPGEWHRFAVRNSALRNFDKDGKRAGRP